MPVATNINLLIYTSEYKTLYDRTAGMLSRFARYADGQAG